MSLLGTRLLRAPHPALNHCHLHSFHVNPGISWNVHENVEMLKCWNVEMFMKIGSIRKKKQDLSHLSLYLSHPKSVSMQSTGLLAFVCFCSPRFLISLTSCTSGKAQLWAFSGSSKRSSKRSTRTVSSHWESLGSVYAWETIWIYTESTLNSRLFYMLSISVACHPTWPTWLHNQSAPALELRGRTAGKIHALTKQFFSSLGDW